MSKTTTVHTPEMTGRKLATFPVTTLEELGRNRNGGWAKFVSTLPSKNPLGKLGPLMEWTEPGKKEKLVNLDGSLDASQMRLTPKNDELSKNELEMDISKVLGFQIVRREIKGKNGKGFRWDLRFQVMFDSEVGCAELESYFIRTSPSPLTQLIVWYTEEPEQTEIPEVRANDEQRQAALEIN